MTLDVVWLHFYFHLEELATVDALELVVLIYDMINATFLCIAFMHPVRSWFRHRWIKIGVVKADVCVTMLIVLWNTIEIVKKTHRSKIFVVLTCLLLIGFIKIMLFSDFTRSKSLFYELHLNRTFSPPIHSFKQSYRSRSFVRECTTTVLQIWAHQSSGAAW